MQHAIFFPLWARSRAPSGIHLPQAVFPKCFSSHSWLAQLLQRQYQLTCGRGGLPRESNVLTFPACAGMVLQYRASSLLELLASAMRCPGHSPRVLSTCAAAAAAGRPVCTPPCASALDCCAVTSLWKHYCEQHHHAPDKLREQCCSYAR